MHTSANKPLAKNKLLANKPLANKPLANKPLEPAESSWICDNLPL